MCSFLFQIWKLYTIITINSWLRCFEQERKNILLTGYLETKSFKTVLKLMQPTNILMIYYWDKKLKKWLHILEADITI